MISPDLLEQIEAEAFLGLPSKFAGIGKIYPLTIAEVVEMGVIEYNKRVGLLLLTEVEIQKIIKEKSGVEVSIEDIKPLNYLLASANSNDTFFLELQDSFSTFLKEEVLLLPEIGAVLINPQSPQDKRLITEENFVEFQNILRIQNRKEVKTAPPKNETFGERKMRLLRERVAEAKKKKAGKDGSKIKLADMLEIATVFGIDTSQCSFYAFYGLIKRYQLKEKWEQDVAMLCAGASSKDLKTKYWGESSKEN